MKQTTLTNAISILFNSIIIFSLLFLQISPVAQAASKEPGPTPNFYSEDTQEIPVTAITKISGADTKDQCSASFCIFLPIVMKNSTLPQPGPDLEISISDHDSSVRPGGSISYTLTYRNNGPVEASGVKLQGTLPENAIFNAQTSTPGWQQIGTSQEYTLQIGLLTPGMNGEAIFSFTLPETLPPDVVAIIMTGFIEDDGIHGADPNPANNNATEITPIDYSTSSLNLEIAVSDGGISANPNGSIIYTISYQNLGNIPASGVILHEILPTNTVFNNSESTAGWQAGANGQFTFPIGELAVAGNGTVLFCIDVNSAIPAGVETIENTTSISDDGLNGSDVDPSNNFALTSTVLTAQPDLTIIKEDGVQYTQPGETIIYSLTYSNQGNQVATGVKLTEILPINSSYVGTLSSPGWQQIGTTTIYEYFVGNLEVSGSGVVEFAVEIDDPLPTGMEAVENTTTISDDLSNGIDPTAANNSSTTSTPVNSAPDLAISKAGPDLIYPGELVVYSISYNNLGFSTAENILITETLPEHTTFNAAASDPGWVQIEASNQYSFSIASLEPGAGGEVLFAVTIDSPIPTGVTGITNVVNIVDDGSNGIDPNLENNESEFINLFSSGSTSVCGAITANTTWSPATSPYIVTCDVTINAGVTLTILPGTIIKFNSNSRRLIVNGTLLAEGNAISRIQFTSYKDDSIGGDTNGDGNASTPARGDWNTIQINDTGSATLRYVTIQYGGYSSTYYANLYLTQNASATVENSTISNSLYYGVRINNITSGKVSRLTISSSTIESNTNRGMLVYTSSGGTSQVNISGTTIQNNGNTGFETNNGSGLSLVNSQFHNNNGYAAHLTLSGNAVPDLTGVSGSGNRKNGVALIGPFAVSSTLSYLTSMTYLMPNSWVVNAGVTLIIPAGQVVKAESTSGYIRANGILIAQGTVDARVVFTSLKDDALGGDTNFDGNTTLPAKGDWQGITVPAGGKVVLDQAIVLYAGNTGSAFDALVNVDSGGDLMLQNSHLGFSAFYGVRVNGIETQSILNTTITDCSNHGIYIVDITNNIPLSPELHNNTINNTQIPIYLTNSSDGLTGILQITGNHGTGNTLGYIYLVTKLVGMVEFDGSNEFDWYFNNDITLTGGSQWVLGPGEVIKIGISAYHSNHIDVQGTLVVKGESGAPVVFTSINDNAYGQAIGSNPPAKSDWGGINIQQGGSGIIDHAVIRYGGQTIFTEMYSMLEVKDGGSLVVTNSLLEHSGSYGIYVNRADTAVVTNPEIRNNEINDCMYPIYIRANGGFTGEYRITNNSGTGNTRNYIRLENKLVGSVKLGSSNALDWVFENDVLVRPGSKWELGPGEVIKIGISAYHSNHIDVQGTLVVKGEVVAPVVFTSINDNAYGQAIGTLTPAKSDWGGINVQAGGNAIIDHAVIRYGGQTGFTEMYSMLEVKDGGSLVVTNSLLEHSGTYGIYVNRADTAVVTNPEIRNNEINDCMYPIYIRANGGFTGEYRITNNSGTGNTRNYIRLENKLVGSVKLGNSNALDWVFENDVLVSPGSKWELGPGEVIKIEIAAYHSAQIDVQGTLVVKGEVVAPVVFTSINDNAFGQAIGTLAPAKGDWGGIDVLAGGKAILDHATIRYGGSSAFTNMYSLLEVKDGGSLVVTNSLLEHSSTYGIGVYSGNHLINGNRLNDISNYGVYNGNPTNIRVKAENNWWGAENGPSPFGDGYGINYRTCRDETTGETYICEYYVDAVPWVGQDYGSSQDLIDAELPEEPNRNTAPMEPGVPYIEYVKSQQGFFYLNDESIDNIEIRIDWNGSEEGIGDPGKLLIMLDGASLVEIQATQTIVTYSLNIAQFSRGRTNLCFVALVDQGMVASEFFNIYAMKINIPQWLGTMMASTGAVYFKVQVKPDYTEAKAGIKIPSIEEKYELLGFDLFDNPVYEKIDLPEFEIKADVSLRTDGIGSISGEAHIGREEETEVEGGEKSGAFYLIVQADGEIDFSESYFEVTGAVGIGVGGEVKYRFPLIALLGGAVPVALAEIPGVEDILKVIYLQIKINPELVLDMGYVASEQDDQVRWESLYFDGEIKASVGAGFSIVTDGFLNMEFYGGGTIEPEFCLIPDLEWKEMGGSFFIGTKISAFYMFEEVVEHPWPVETIKGPAYYSCGGKDIENPQADTTRIDESSNLFETSKLTVEHPIYNGDPYAQFNKDTSKVTSQKINDNSSKSSEDFLLISNLYKNGSPAIASRGGRSMLMWVHDDLNLGDAQSKELLYSIKGIDGWSAPIQLTNNLMVDHSPVLAFMDETHILAVWQQINDSTIPDDGAFTPDIAKKGEILFAIFDFISNTWTIPAYLTNNNILDARAKIAVGNDGTLMVFWIRNAYGNLFGSQENPSQIVSATWDGENWNERDVTPAILTGVLTFEVGVNSFNDATVVFSSDGTGEFSMLEKLELYWLQWDGLSWSSPVRITSNYLMDDNPFIYYTATGERWLVWNQGGNIKILKNDWTETPISTVLSAESSLMRTFKVTSDNSANLFAVWQSNSEAGSDLYISLYDALTDSWKLQEQLTSSLGVERQYSISFGNSLGQVDIAYLFDNLIIGDKTFNGETYHNVVNYQSTDLHVLQYTPNSDLSVENLVLPYRPNPEPGETVTIQADLVNSGDWAVENPSISFFDGDPNLGGSLIATYSHTGTLAAGLSLVAEVQWLVPLETLTSKTIFAVVDPDGVIDERDESNNRTSLITILPDLTVSSVSTYYYDQHNLTPLAVIYNNGKLRAENVLVEFRNGTEDGPVVYSEIVPVIEKESIVAVSTQLSVAGWTPGNYKYFVSIDVANQIHEGNEGNNSDYFSVAVLPDPVIYAGDISATLVEGIGGSVNVKVRNWGTTSVENLVVQLFEGPDIDLSRPPLNSWTIPSLAVDEITTLTTTIDHIPYHLFAVADPGNSLEEIHESNNIAFEALPVVHGGMVTVVGASDPNLADIIYTPAEFDNSSGGFELQVQANLYDVNLITLSPQLCDISALGEFTGLQGKIALVERTPLCTYSTQINNAAVLGAAAVLVYNNLAGGNLREVMTGLPVNVPAGFLARQDGVDLIGYHDQAVWINSRYEEVTIFDPYR